MEKLLVLSSVQCVGSNHCNQQLPPALASPTAPAVDANPGRYWTLCSNGSAGRGALVPSNPPSAHLPCRVKGTQDASPGCLPPDHLLIVHKGRERCRLLYEGYSERVSLTATQLQALEIILISFLVWLTYSKTISGLTKILTMLEQHFHRGLREVERGAFMLPLSKSAAGRACQGNNKRHKVLARATLFSKTGRDVEKECCLEGSNVRGWQAMRSLLPSPHMLHFAASGLHFPGRAQGRLGLNPGMGEVSAHLLLLHPPAPRQLPAGVSLW